jgi:26S proteasome regulatory subunit N9
MEVPAYIPFLLGVTGNQAGPYLEDVVHQIGLLWDRRLWHQLTLELEKFFKHPHSVGLRMKIFKDFVTSFEKNINQRKLVEFAILSTEDCVGMIPMERHCI